MDRLDWKNRPWLSPREAARLLNVSRETIYRMVERAELPAIRAGRTIRIPTEAVTEGAWEGPPTSSGASGHFELPKPESASLRAELDQLCSELE